MSQVQKTFISQSSLDSRIVDKELLICMMTKEDDQGTQFLSLPCLFVEAKSAHRHKIEKIVLTLPYVLFINYFWHFFSPPMTSELLVWSTRLSTPPPSPCTWLRLVMPGLDFCPHSSSGP